MSNITGLPRPLTDSDIAYIRDNHHNTPANAMAKHLGRTGKTIRTHMDENGLKIFRSREYSYQRPVPTKSEFFEYDKKWII